jgi:hypothetical protein
MIARDRPASGMESPYSGRFSEESLGLAALELADCVTPLADGFMKSREALDRVLLVLLENAS